METHDPRRTRVVVVGAGNVGSTYAYTLVLSGLVPELVLIDANRARAEGEAMDLNHAVPFARAMEIWAGDYGDCAGAALTLIAAGSAQRPGETRLDLLRRNAAIFGDIVPRVVAHNPGGIILVATNPVDVLSYAAWKLSGLPSARVIGSGTILDTARFRYVLSQRFDVDPRSVHAYIIGEHGDSEVPVWSLANIAGMRLREYCAAHGLACDDAELEGLFQQVRDAAYEIIAKKGATYYAVAAGLLRITEAVLRDENTVLSVSALVENYAGIDDVYLSLPTVVARSGIVRRLHLNLDDVERRGLRHSADLLRSVIAELDLPRPAESAL
jgi:L-lactate dehydrogenase